MKLRVIDIFNKVFKKELVDGTIFILGECDEFRYDANEPSLDKCFVSTQVENAYLLTDYEFSLSDEIEIIEEKEIEKIIINSCGNIEKKLIDGSKIVLPTIKDEVLHVAYKLNELIDEVNKLKK